MPGIELNRRSREVLHTIIRQFVRTGRPVGSRSVAKEYPEKLSAATIRNIMSDLEELGLLQQPHTSAGRVPTDLAYRLYVDSLSLDLGLGPEDRRLVMEGFESLDGNVDAILEKVSRFLSSVSHQIGVVLLSPIDRSPMRRMEFVDMGSRRVLALFVSESGVVSQRLVMLDEDLSQEELDRVGRYLTESFRGHNLRRIREKLLALMAEEKALYDQLLSRVLDVSRRYFAAEAGSSSQVYLEGTSNLLSQPEFSDADRMRTLFRTFEEKGRLVKILNRCLQEGRLSVSIGSEIGDPDMSSTSLVASPYFAEGRALGTLGIIGPTRMEYPRLIAMVGLFGRLVSERLSRSTE